MGEMIFLASDLFHETLIIVCIIKIFFQYPGVSLRYSVGFFTQKSEFFKIMRYFFEEEEEEELQGNKKRVK